MTTVRHGLAGLLEVREMLQAVLLPELEKVDVNDVRSPKLTAFHLPGLAGFLTRAADCCTDKATVSWMTAAAVKEAEGSKEAEEKTLSVTPLHQLQLDMVTKF